MAMFGCVYHKLPLVCKPTEKSPITIALLACVLLFLDYTSSRIFAICTYPVVLPCKCSN